MDKQDILNEIKRTAAQNGGVPLGRERFVRETGIKPYDWQKHWATLGDAQREAGFEPNLLQTAFDEKLLLEKLADLVRQLGRLPTDAHILLRRNKEPDFPSKGAFARLGNRQQVAQKLAAFCTGRLGYEDILSICTAKLNEKGSQLEDAVSEGEQKFGYVYLFKSGRDYKIGYSYSPGRRESELNAGAPQGVNLIHQIKTDDPEGVEKYWHNRFSSKRKRDRHEWFALGAEDIRAFKRWRRIF